MAESGKMTFGEFIAKLQQDGAHHVVIKEYDHRTQAAFKAIGSESVMNGFAKSDTRVYIESPASANAWLRDHQRDQVSDKAVREGITPRYGPGTDKIFEDTLINAKKSGVHLRFHDHGYDQILNPKFPENIKEQGKHALKLALEGDLACYKSYLEGLPEKDAKAIDGAIGDAFTERLKGSNDATNSIFVSINSEGRKTVTVIGAKHQQFFEHFRDSSMAKGQKTLDVTAFDSSKPIPAFMIGEDGKVKDDSVIGEYAYDVKTSQYYHIPKGSKAREQFFDNVLNKMEKEKIEKAPPGTCVKAPGDSEHITPKDKTGMDHAAAKLPAHVLADAKGAVGDWATWILETLRLKQQLPRTLMLMLHAQSRKLLWV